MSQKGPVSDTKEKHNPFTNLHYFPLCIEDKQAPFFLQSALLWNKDKNMIIRYQIQMAKWWLSPMGSTGKE